ncbi:MAG: hypothetical protein ACKPKO_28840, partial [Candidatus Fonsibacter sp.]
CVRLYTHLHLENRILTSARQRGPPYELDWSFGGHLIFSKPYDSKIDFSKLDYGYEYIFFWMKRRPI